MKKRFYKNHRIKKKWGQVFLKDENIINSIIHFFNPKKNQKIIEIGPGLGALTKPILNIVDFLILIERDSQLINSLLQIFDPKKIKIFNQDVMEVNFLKFITQSGQKLRLVGNLPYNISTKLIIHLFKYINIIHDMHFMFQKEVGERIIAQPNNKKYGRLSVITQYHYQVSLLLEVSKTSFIPTPKIDSVMLKFIPYHNNNPYPIINIKLLLLITQLAFHQRRKIIQNSLSELISSSDMIQNNIDSKLRAENLTIQQFCTLTTILYNKPNNIDF